MCYTPASQCELIKIIPSYRITKLVFNHRKNHKKRSDSTRIFCTYPHPSTDPSAMLSAQACFYLGGYIPGVRASWARGTWRCNSRPSLVLSRKGKLRHAPAKTWRGLRIPSFSLVPYLSLSFSLRSLPRSPASGGNENPENVACTASVSADARDSRSKLGSSLPPSYLHLLSLSFSFSAGHVFLQSGSLIPWIWFLFLLQW